MTPISTTLSNPSRPSKFQSQEALSLVVVAALVDCVSGVAQGKPRPILATTSTAAAAPQTSELDTAERPRLYTNDRIRSKLQITSWYLPVSMRQYAGQDVPCLGRRTHMAQWGRRLRCIDQSRISTRALPVFCIAAIVDGKYNK
jgi:hypothetical protein